jgi:hypothetical protein
MVQVEIVMRRTHTVGVETEGVRSHDDGRHYHPHLLQQASLLNVIDSFPIELLFPIRQGRSAQQLGGKNRDKGRWASNCVGSSTSSVRWWAGIG